MAFPNISSRNDSKPHPMSPESSRTGQSNLFQWGEDCQQTPEINSDQASERSGGVGAGGGNGKDTGISREISAREAAKLQLGTQAGPTSKVSEARGEVGVARSSKEPGNRKSSGEPRGGTRTHAIPSNEGEGDGFLEGEYLFEKITTPLKVRKLQRTLYRKAKAEPQYRFWSLYGDICREDVLETAMSLVAANGGGAGIDGQLTTAYSQSEEAWVRFRDRLLQELKSKTYQPSPVRRVWIPKADGKMRPLGIPTVKDRVVQGATVLVLMAIYEADFHAHSYAYRPGKNAHQAIDAIRDGLRSGRTEIIDADLSGYFDSIPHDKLMELVARRISDGSVLGLIRAWLRAPIVEEDRDQGSKRILPSEQGTPQGGVISPLLANLYLDALDKAVNDKCGPDPVMVRYADDFVILCPQGRGAKYLERLQRWLTARGLKLNETKTRLLDARQERFKFLGFSLHMGKHPLSGRRYPHVEPHAKSCGKLRESIRKELNHWTLHRSAEEAIQTINRKVKGWAGYFHYGNSTRVFSKMQWNLNQKVRQWLWRKHKRRLGKFKHYPDEVLYDTYGLWKLPLRAAWKCA